MYNRPLTLCWGGHYYSIDPKIAVRIVIIIIIIGKGLELLIVNGGRFEINQELFADDTSLVADSEEKLCRLVSEFM